MRLGWRRRQAAGERKLSWWVVVVYAVTAVGIGAGVVWWTWPSLPLDSAVEQIKAETQAVRTGLAAAGGAGAAFTLLLAVHRQRATEHDAAEQRVTALYTTAVEQLGHESAAVRLGGLYALQRLGQGHPGQRRAIVNVWCAYLRMPYADPDADGLDEVARAARRQELQVRATVQDLLRQHAHPALEVGTDDPRYWGDQLALDLTGATLHHLDWSRLRIHPHIRLNHTRFIGDARFFGATFTGDAWFDEATFIGEATFSGATFTGDATFRGATFTGDARFDNKATFTREATFSGATFTRITLFDRATFTRDAVFVGATFTRDAWFDEATFNGDAKFTRATFTRDAVFDEATFVGDACFTSDTRFDGDAEFDGAQARAEGKHQWPPGWRLAPADHPDAETDDQGHRLVPLLQDSDPDTPDDSEAAPSA